ncbi:MAG TPA: hypothetical protein VEY96_08210 [Actinomycetes bacterium]|nr:hypothetical protein [Actinomycetes bacterium]
MGAEINTIVAKKRALKRFVVEVGAGDQPSSAKLEKARAAGETAAPVQND